MLVCRVAAVQPCLSRSVRLHFGLERSRAIRCFAQQQTLEDQPSDFEDEAVGRNFASSLATLGLGAALLSERLNGVGVVRQLELSFSGMDPLLMCIIGALLVATFKPPERRTESGASAIYSVQDAVGRLSFLGLASTLAAEMVTGQGLLGLLHIDTGVELSEIEGVLAFFIMLILVGPRSHANPKT